MPEANYHEEAKQDLADAAAYYARERPGLEKDFFDVVFECELQILQFPEAGKKIHGEIRCRFLTSYPYAMCYICEPDGHIRVIAVAHMKRKPLYWLGRER